MKIRKIITLTSVIAVLSISQAFGAITLGLIANTTTGAFATSGGTLLNGSYRVGYLNEGSVTNFANYANIDAQFTQLFAGTNIVSGAVSTTGNNVGVQPAGSALYVWVSNSTTHASGTEWGVFKSPVQWVTPADLGNTNLVTNAANRTAVYGSIVSNQLRTVPEPSTYAALFGIAVLGLAVLRRRAKQA